MAWVRVPSLAQRARHPHVLRQQPDHLVDGGVRGRLRRRLRRVWHLKESGTGQPERVPGLLRYANHGQGTGRRPTRPRRGSAGRSASPSISVTWPTQTYDFIDVGQDGTLNITGDRITLQAWLQHNITPNTAHGCDKTVYTNNCGDPYVSNPYGILNHKGYNDGYRFYLSGDPGSCPNPNGGSGGSPMSVSNMAIPGTTDLIASSQYGSPATDPVTRGVVAPRRPGVDHSAEMKPVRGRPAAAGHRSTGLGPRARRRALLLARRPLRFGPASGARPCSSTRPCLRV